MNIIKKVTAATITIAMMSNIIVYADSTTSSEQAPADPAVYESVTPCVLSASGENSGIHIYSDNFTYYGDLSAVNKVEIYSTNINANGLISENDIEFDLDSFDELISSINYTSAEQTFIYDLNYQLDIPCKFPGYTNSSSRITLSSQLYTDDSINLFADEISSENDNDQIILSENGSITINCKKFDYTGMLYAPNGSITINADTINIVGFAIADNIVFNAKDISVSENYDLYSAYEEKEIAYQEGIDELTNNYIDIVNELNDADTERTEDEINALESEYNALRSVMEEKDLLLSDEEITEFFGQTSQPQQPSQTSPRARAAFKPCKGIEDMYDVIRKKSTYTYKKKSYYYYSLEVTDKWNPSRARFRKHYSPNLFLIGNCKNENAAKNLLNKSFKTAFGAGLSAILEASGHKVAGVTVKAVIGAISAYGKPGTNDVYTNSHEFFRLDDVNVDTTMRYYWVKYKGQWEFAYSCDRTIWQYRFTIGKLNKKTRQYKYSTPICEFTNNGTYFKPYKAIAAIVDYKKLHGDKATVGYDPYGYYKTKSYTIKNSDGKTLQTFKPLFVRKTIDLM